MANDEKTVEMRFTVPESDMRAVIAARAAADSKAIRVWHFDDAPADLRSLSTNGGDEDWLAIVPAEVWDEEGGWIRWMEGSGFDTTHNPEYHRLMTGDMVVIGTHA